MFIKGSAVKVTSSQGSPATQTVIAAQKGGGLTIKVDKLDTTNKDTSGFKSALAGLAEWSIDFDGIVIAGDTTQGALRSAVLAGSTVSVEVQGIDGPASGSPATPSKFAGTAIIESISWDFSDTEAVKFKATLTGASALTYTAAGS